jgi:23S rRNA pseudouridine2605 synthase
MVGHWDHRKHPRAGGQAVASPAPVVGDAAPASGERVAKALARAGVASRREVERLIGAGRVALNGQILTTPAVIVTASDVLSVDGEPIAAAEPARVFRYHKPQGLVTTHRDPGGRPTVFEALPPGLPRLISVGRLDLSSEGLLLLTNDGGLARALELPSTALKRQYRARAHGRIDQPGLDRLKDGITVEGVSYGPIEARLDKAREPGAGANLWITLTLAEGKNREVRRVLEALGLKVNRLIRTAYGPFALGTLARGAVEEVGPRVIREQLGHLIAPAMLPTGDRALHRPAAAPGPNSELRREAKPAKPPLQRKPGWAKPKRPTGRSAAGKPGPKGRGAGEAGGRRPPGKRP